jgi:hypothetical protein
VSCDTCVPPPGLDSAGEARMSVAETQDAVTAPGRVVTATGRGRRHMARSPALVRQGEEAESPLPARSSGAMIGTDSPPIT